MRHERFPLAPSKDKRLGLLIICAFLLLGLSQAALAQSGRRPVKRETPAPPPPISVEAKPETERERKRTDDGDDIYNSREVDVQAKITSGRRDRPSPRRGCPDDGRVIIRAVLHKSGKVTNVTVFKGLNCSYDKDAVEIVRRYKFTPAMKDGQPVSQAIQVEFEYRRIL